MIPVKLPEKGSAVKKRLQALGRLPVGKMNSTEAAYAKRLERLKLAGEVLWYKFEGIKLRLADNTFLTIDFPVMLADGQLQMHDVKGSKSVFSDDARVKMKLAADIYPFQIIAAYPTDRKFSSWVLEEF